MIEHTYWISLPYATFLLICQQGRVIETAPISAWARGKPESEVIGYYRRKKATIVPMSG